MHFRQLETFVFLYDTKSFTATARALFISQSAVSQQLHSLETTLGCRLFLRDQHQVTPSPEGDTFYPYARRFLALQQEALQALRPDTPVFYLHFVNGDVHDPIQKALLLFHTQHPEVLTDILPPVPIDRFSAASMLDPGHLYLTRESWIRDRQIHFFSLGWTQYSALLSPEDPLARQESVELKSLLSRNMLVLRKLESAGPFMGPLRRYLASRLPGDQIILQPDMVSALARLLFDRGQSVLILPFYVQVAGEENFVRRPVMIPPPRDPVGLAFVGKPTSLMNAFLQSARGCYQD